jgi:hypothetical protein
MLKVDFLCYLLVGRIDNMFNQKVDWYVIARHDALSPWQESTIQALLTLLVLD